MSNDFINKLYLPSLKESKSDISVLNDMMSESENAFILKHNINAVGMLLRFFESDENIFVLNGFMGAGKSSAVDFALKFLGENVIIFRNSYREAINLDDVLLSVFKDFSIYKKENKIVLPKSETNVFSEKINAFVKGCANPMLFIFDSFEINTRSKDSQKDILDFLNWLSKFSKIKIIICSRTFRQEDLLSDDSVISYSLSPLTLDETKEYLNDKKIQGNNYEIDALYKVSRGHFVLVKYAVHIMSLSGISLGVFEAEYKRSAKNFLDFLVSRILSLSSERYIKALLVFALLRHGVSKNFIIKERLASSDEIDFLLQNNIISERFDKYYMKDHVKKEFLKNINNATQIRVHKYAVDLYESELPLKPFERELFLSRLTMRKEISYHQKRTIQLEEEAQKIGETNREIQGLSYLTYTKTSGYEDKQKTSKPAQKKRYIDILTGGMQKNKYVGMSYDDNVMLNSTKVTDEITKHFEELSKIRTEDAPVEQPQEHVPDSLDEFVEIAKEAENNFDFSGAVKYYEKALTYINDENFKAREPGIYGDLAQCYKKSQNQEKAIECFEKLYELLYMKNPNESFTALMNIGDIYFESYKFDKAKKIYLKILNSDKENIEPVKIRASLNIADIEVNNIDMEKAVAYLQKALMTAEKYSDIKLLCECYYKYAYVLDDINNVDLAEKYYLRCIQTSDNPEENSNLAQAYTSLAEIYSENEDFDKAADYFVLASETDKNAENYDGLYYEYSKLADIYYDTDEEKAFDYLTKALSAAKKLDDSAAALSVYAQTGEIYVNSKSWKKALKAFVSAKCLTDDNTDEDLKKYINSKIDEIKKYTGEVEYIRILNEVKKKDNVRKP